MNSATSSPPTTPPSVRELLLRSDFGRANPRRVDELLARTADPSTEDRNCEETRRAVAR